MIDQAERLRILVRERQGFNRTTECNIIAITSGKGGVGKTTVAVNLAVLLAGFGKKTAIIDADLGLSNVDVILGLAPEYHLGHVLDDGLDLDGVCIEGPYGLKVISGGSGAAKLANLTEVERAYLMARLREFSRRFDFMIIDTSPGIGRNVTDFLALADSINVVTTAEPAAVADCYAAVKTIYLSIPDAHVSLIVNRASDSKIAKQVAWSIDTVLDKFVGKRVNGWNYLPEDSSVMAACHKQKAFTSVYSSSPAAAVLRKIAVRLAGDSVGLRRGKVCTA